METKKYSLTLDSEFVNFCALNKIEDPINLAKQLFNQGFTIHKYGEVPDIFGKREKIVEVPVEVIKEVEKIVEVIKEVPVEKIVEVIKEVPVEVKTEGETIIKEVTVEKIVEVVDTKEIDRLNEENEKLKSELEKLNEALNSINKRGRLMKDSNLSSLYDE